MSTGSTLPLADFVELRDALAPDALAPDAPTPPAFHVAARRRAGRWVVATPDAGTATPARARRGWWAVATSLCGDAPRTYHPKYVMAVLSARADPLAPSAPVETETLEASKVLSAWPIPTVDFTTEEWTRRSMTLNAMRMSTEYFESGSPRVLQLIEQRLAARQRDVVHDALVYLMSAILDARARDREARRLRAASVAAYLGLDETATGHLFASARPDAAAIARRIARGEAGQLRRAIDVEALVAAQLGLLRPERRAWQRAENAALALLDRVVALLRA